MLRGDVDRFYHALKREHPTPPADPIGRLSHVRAIAGYYDRLDQEDRLLLLAWAKKEESGIGIIPLALSAIPFFGLIISARLQELMRQLPIWQIFVVWSLFGSLVVAGFYIHQRQKAYTMLHIVLLEQAIKRCEAEQRQAQAHAQAEAQAQAQSQAQAYPQALPQAPHAPSAPPTHTVPGVQAQCPAHPIPQGPAESQEEAQAESQAERKAPEPEQDRLLTLPPAPGTH